MPTPRSRVHLALCSLLPALAAAAGGALGIDIGGANSVVASARRGGIDVLTNEASMRQTPSLVAFSEQQRLLGQSATTEQSRSPENSVAGVKRFVGLCLAAAVALQRPPAANIVAADSDCEPPLFEVQLGGVTRRFSALQILAMLMHQLHRTAQRELHTAAFEGVAIAVPMHFTAERRRAVLDAAEVAGLPGVRLISDGAAVALDYALGRAELPPDTDHNVAFVDAGNDGVQVCIVRFRRGSLQLLAHDYAENAGGAVREHTAPTLPAPSSCLACSPYPIAPLAMRR